MTKQHFTIVCFMIFGLNAIWTQNIGINTTTPSAKLDIINNTNTGYSLKIRPANSKGEVWMDSTGNITMFDPRNITGINIADSSRFRLARTYSLPSNATTRAMHVSAQYTTGGGSAIDAIVGGSGTGMGTGSSAAIRAYNSMNYPFAYGIEATSSASYGVRGNAYVTGRAGVYGAGYTGSDGVSGIAFSLTGAGGYFSGNKYALITGSGNVGIGTTTPTAPLSFLSSLGNKINLWGNADTSHYGIGIQGSLYQHYVPESTASIAFGVGRSANFQEKMRIRGDGRVGIGTSNPSGLLSIKGDTNNLYLFNIRKNNLQSKLIVDSTGKLTIGDIQYISFDGSKMTINHNPSTTNVNNSGLSIFSNLTSATGKGLYSVLNGSITNTFASAVQGEDQMSSSNNAGVLGRSTNGYGVRGSSTNSFGGFFESNNNVSLYATTGINKTAFATQGNAGIGTSLPEAQFGIRSETTSNNIIKIKTYNFIEKFRMDSLGRIIAGDISQIYQYDTANFFVMKTQTTSNVLNRPAIGVSNHLISGNGIGIHSKVSSISNNANYGVGVRGLDNTTNANSIGVEGVANGIGTGVVGHSVNGVGARFSTLNGAAALVTGIGKVGFGINNPQTHMHIHHPESFGNILHITNSGTGTSGADGYKIGMSSLGTLLFTQLENAGITFRQFNDDVMTIANNGNVNIGASSSPSEKLRVEGNITLTGNVINEAVTPSPLQANWTNYGSEFEIAGYYMDKEKRVHLRGLVYNDINAQGTVIFNLPSAYRPQANGQLIFVVMNQNGVGRLDVKPNGDVVLEQGINGWVSLSGVSWRVE